MALTAADCRVHIVCTSHWDREWYLSAERFRFRLVGMLDTVLDLLEKYPAYTFTLDGQAIIIEDYLEIRPEREGQLHGFLATGRLVAGPWYVQPDEFLVSAEALRRNLRLGMATVRHYGGEPSQVGYLPDAFGHIANLPAILRGEGIESAIFTRGADSSLGDWFRWKAADGTEIAAHCQPIGYGLTVARNPDTAELQLQNAVNRLAAAASVPALLLQLGSDHSRPQSHVPALLERLDHATFSTHDRFVQDTLANAGDWPEYRGELRFSREHPVLNGTLSARLYLKLRNFELDDRLRYTTEPLLELACPVAPQPAPEYLNRAWRVLIQNHPHDSICGCSIDAVHDLMDTRSQTVEDIATELELDALSRLSHLPEYAGKLLVLNPFASPYLETTLLVSRAELAQPTPPVPLTATWQVISSEHISTLAGPASALPEWLEQLDDRHPVRTLSWAWEGSHLVIEVDEGARHPDAPAPQTLLSEAISRQTSTVEIRVYRSEVALSAHLPAGARVLPWGTAAIEQERLPDHLAVTIEPDGTLTVTELGSGYVTRALHRLEDVGDRGDSYTFSRAARPEVAAEFLGVAYHQQTNITTEWILHYRLTLPTHLEPDRQTGSAQTVQLDLTTQVVLRTGARHLEFTTTFMNTAQDHRLRVHFGDSVAESWADSAEAVVQRQAPQTSTTDWVDQPGDSYPLAHWAAQQEKDGLLRGVAVRGLTEYGHTGGLSLTLVRAVGFISRSDLPERPSQAGPPYAVQGAQCLRPMTVQYAWIAGLTDLTTFDEAALSYAHPARGWFIPALS